MTHRLPAYLMLTDASSEEVYDSVWRTKRLAARFHRNSPLVHPESGTANEDVGEQLRRLESLRLEQYRLVSRESSEEKSKSELQRVSREINELESELASLSSPLEREIAIRDATLEDLRVQLSDDRAVIDIAVVNLPDRKEGLQFKTWKQHFFAFVLTKDTNELNVKQIDLGPVAAITKAAEAFRRDLSGADFRERFWNPIEATLEGRKRITIVPDRGLHCIPWAAIPGRMPETFLIDDGYVITQVGFAQQICAYGNTEASGNTKPQRIGLVGDVHFGERSKQPVDDGGEYAESVKRGGSFRNWPALPGSGAEVDELRKLLTSSGHGQIEILRGAEATDTQLVKMAKESDILHIATHAFFSRPVGADVLPINLRSAKLFPGSTWKQNSVAARNPLLLAGLALAGANSSSDSVENDGILFADEIARLDLQNTKLLVLSGCDTAAGEPVSNDVAQGLSTAGHLAGIQAIVSSLWDVDDDSTVRLMKRFYFNYLAEEQPIDVALAMAQRDLLKEARRFHAAAEKRGTNTKKVRPVEGAPKSSRLHPRHWAGFVVSGSGF